VLGIVTKFDFLKTSAFTTGQILPQYDELMRRRVAEIMTEAVVHVDPSAPLTRLLQSMVSLKARSFPVHRSARRAAWDHFARKRDARALKWATT
jgi:CBS domain-containing protein